MLIVTHPPLCIQDQQPVRPALAAAVMW